MTSTPLPPLSAPVSSPAETGWKGGREPRYNYNIQQPGMFPPGAGNCPVKLSDLGNLGEFVRIPDLANLKQTEYLSAQIFHCQWLELFRGEKGRLKNGGNVTNCNILILPEYALHVPLQVGTKPIIKDSHESIE